MTLERRGRPRKLEPTSSPTTPTFEEKPREERSYKDFFPDLNIKEPLPIINLSDQSIKSPSSDDYKTASEGDLRPIEKIIKLPVASFKRIDPIQPSPKDDEAQVFHRPENHYIRYIGKLAIARKSSLAVYLSIKQDLTHPFFLNIRAFRIRII